MKTTADLVVELEGERIHAEDEAIKRLLSQAIERKTDAAETFKHRKNYLDELLSKPRSELLEEADRFDPDRRRR